MNGGIMIERIYAKNYRAFEKIDIPLTKINLFFGPNNSGKSSIMSLINLLSQTLSSSDHIVPLLLRGGKEDLGTYRDLIYENKVKKSLTIGIEVCPKPIYRFQNLGRKEKKQIKGSIELKYQYKPNRHEIVLSKIKSYIPNENVKLTLNKQENGKNYRIAEFIIDNEKSQINKRITIFEHFFPSIWDLDSSSHIRDDHMQRVSHLRFFYYEFAQELKNIEFIGPFREPPSRTYLFSGESPDSVGVHGERTVDIMTIDYLKHGKEKRDIVKKASDWFNGCGISDELKVHRLTDRHFEIVLSQKGLYENMADTGYGCSQVLPILVAGYNLDEGDIFLVQEPEIHLHPRAQAELGTFFYQLSNKGIQTILETHSEHMLLRLQAHVADKNCKLKPEDINIYYVYVNEDGERNIKKLNLKPDGFFEDDWPQGFFPERYNEAKKIAKASLRG